jgi:hypothetical protein
VKVTLKGVDDEVKRRNGKIGESAKINEEAGYPTLPEKEKRRAARTAVMALCALDPVCKRRRFEEKTSEGCASRVAP